MRVGLHVQFACGPYDRIEALRTGELAIPGIDLEIVTVQSPRELFDRMTRGAEFQVSEMSVSEFVSEHCAGLHRYVAIPVFPSKAFRHGFITINTRAGIAKPGDLAGRRIGLPLYTQTAAIWCRGLLEDEYGVDLSEVTWIQGSVESAGAHGNPTAPPLLRPIRLENNRSHHSLDDLLVAGEIDALIGARLPPSLGKRPEVARLFPDFRTREQDYFRRTSIHPIMHLVVIERGFYEAHPWIAPLLFDGLNRAKNKAWADLRFSGAQKSMMPWAFAEVQEVLDTFGEDPWPYGVEPNRATLERLIDYMHRQNFIATRPKLEDLFVSVSELEGRA